MTTNVTAVLFFLNGLFAMYLCGRPMWAGGFRESLRIRLALALFSDVFMGCGFWLLYTGVFPE